jgi:hypothetical protein
MPASLYAVRSSTDAERAPGGAGEPQAEVVGNRLFNLGEPLRAPLALDGHLP